MNPTVLKLCLQQLRFKCRTIQPIKIINAATETPRMTFISNDSRTVSHVRSDELVDFSRNTVAVRLIDLEKCLPLCDQTVASSPRESLADQLGTLGCLYLCVTDKRVPQRADND